MLIDLLRARRCLLVLDNLETIIQAGTQARTYRADYADYGALIERISASPPPELPAAHQPREAGRAGAAGRA